MLEDEYTCAYRRYRRQIISVPNDSPNDQPPNLVTLLRVQDMHLYLRSQRQVQ